MSKRRIILLVSSGCAVFAAIAYFMDVSSLLFGKPIGVLVKCEQGDATAVGRVLVYDAGSAKGFGWSVDLPRGEGATAERVCDRIGISAGMQQLKTKNMDKTSLVIYGSDIRVTVPKGINIKITTLRRAP